MAVLVDPHFLKHRQVRGDHNVGGQPVQLLALGVDLGRDLVALAGELVALADQFDVVEGPEGCQLLAKQGILVLELLCSLACSEDR
jgi:hypothetical protein